MSNTADAVRALIHEAWRACERPAGDRISSPTYDDEGVAAYFRGRSWFGHDVASLRYHEVGLSFMTAEAFCYYFAAYMLAVLEDERAADVIYDGILFHLSPRQLGKQWADSYRARIAGFSRAQLHAIIGYLEWCAEHHEYDRRDISATIHFFAKGTPPEATSALDHLLALAGEDDPATATLQLANTTVCDADLGALAGMPALRELDLGGTAITDDGLAQLAGAAPGLEVLKLSGCKAITARGLAHVGRLAKLAELQLSNADVDDAGLHALAPLRLRRLQLVLARRITPAGWDAVDLDQLEALEMYGVDAPDTLLARLGRTGRIRELEIRTAGDAGLAALCEATSLATFEAGDVRTVTERGLAALAALPELRELQLGSLAAVPWPPGFAALEKLTLIDAQLHPAGPGPLPALAELGLFGGRVEAGSLATFARMPRLRALTLWCAGITDATLLELAGCASLQALSIHATPITGTGLAVAARLPELATLRLDGLARLDDAWLLELTRAPHLRELVLDEVPVTDAGLSRLAGCPQLRSVRLTHTSVTPAGLAAFRQAGTSIELVEL